MANQQNTLHITFPSILGSKLQLGFEMTKAITDPNTGKVVGRIEHVLINVDIVLLQYHINP